MKKSLILLGALLAAVLTGADIFLAGDSTMCHYPPSVAPREGWGMHLQAKCRPGVKVHNHAVSGTSTKSFQERGFWEKMLKLVKPGDFVVIGMGINDGAPKNIRPQNHTDVGGEFEGNLKRWIGEVRAKGGIPVLCTETVIWDAKKPTVPHAYREKYNQAIRRTAAECNCACVDLGRTAFTRLLAMTQEETATYYMSHQKDWCHLTAKGAEFYAALFVELCKEQQLPAAGLFR